jgi:SAM-dependent methyltransferase
MDPEPLISQSSRDAEAVRDFFNGWNLYRRIVDNDYLYHRSVKASLGEWLNEMESELGRPFSFLDLGCGDGLFSSEVLEGRNLSSYTGMDISPVALDLAARNTLQLKAPCTLRAGDFMTEIASLPDTYDIIYIGLSLNHLPRVEKE